MAKVSLAKKKVVSFTAISYTTGLCGSFIKGKRRETPHVYRLQGAM